MKSPNTKWLDKAKYMLRLTVIPFLLFVVFSSKGKVGLSICLFLCLHVTIYSLSLRLGSSHDVGLPGTASWHDTCKYIFDVCKYTFDARKYIFDVCKYIFWWWQGWCLELHIWCLWLLVNTSLMLVNASLMLGNTPWCLEVHILCLWIHLWCL